MGRSRKMFKRYEGIVIPPEQLENIVVPREGHPLFDREGNDLEVSERLVQSIMACGVKAAIKLRKEGEAYLIVDGRQRHKALIEANKRLKKAGSELHSCRAELELGDQSAALGVCIALNAIRRVPSILAQAELCRQYLETGRSEEEAANRFGVTMQTISNWKATDTLSAGVKKAINEGVISASAAVKWKDLPPSEQNEKLADAVKDVKPGKRVTVAQVAPKKKKAKDDEGLLLESGNADKSETADESVDGGDKAGNIKSGAPGNTGSGNASVDDAPKSQNGFQIKALLSLCRKKFEKLEAKGETDLMLQGYIMALEWVQTGAPESMIDGV